jgi:ABC-type sugar transport system ATPase subunit
MLAQLDRTREKRESADYIRMMHIRPPSMRLNLLHYSGGNQQKFCSRGGCRPGHGF